MPFSNFTTFACFLPYPKYVSAWATCAQATPEIRLTSAELAMCVTRPAQATGVRVGMMLAWWPDADHWRGLDVRPNQLPREASHADLC
jgi:hypothetical protein